MIRTAKRFADRLLDKFVPATDAIACITVCEPVIVDGQWCCRNCNGSIVCP